MQQRGGPGGWHAHTQLGGGNLVTHACARHTSTQQPGTRYGGVPDDVRSREHQSRPGGEGGACNVHGFTKKMNASPMADEGCHARWLPFRCRPGRHVDCSGVSLRRWRGGRLSMGDCAGGG